MLLRCYCYSLSTLTLVLLLFFSFLSEQFIKTLPEYHVVDPARVDASGHFLSFDLHHHISNTRKKRDLSKKENLVYYKINHKEKDLFFNLTVHLGFLSHNYVVERRRGNHTSAKIATRSGVPCHFIGTVLQPGSESGTAAISTCYGLTGYFHLPHGNYFIEPIKKHPQKEGTPHPHIIYGANILQNALRRRRAILMEKEQQNRRERWEQSHMAVRKVSRRSVSKERWVETLVVADSKMVEYHGSDHVESYILTIMNMVTGLFHDPSIGNAIHIVLVRLILFEEEEQGLKIVHHADKTLASFCKWQKSVNPKSDINPTHHDVAVLLTRKDICAGMNRPCETLGLSHLSGMCQPHRSCNINEDSGLPLAFTIAHELGHSFGIQHDGKENDCEPIGKRPYIMSRQLQYDPTPLTWSQCSKEYITRFLDRGWGFCLDDIPQKKVLKSPIIAPGVIYDVHHQCQLQYGSNATFCEDVDNLCQTLWCSVKGSCRSKLDAAADGTRCGENKWCFSGECITVGKTPEAIHGGWGVWSSWSHCTRTCGAGVQSAERPCDNPEPQFGGDYCTGERKRYRICNVSPCRKGLPTFRQMQCSEFDTVPYQNEFYHWVPVYNTANPCELHCRPVDGHFSEKMLDAVTDGTPCFEGRHSRDICINGMCKTVGCDYEINSNATEDQCGVCLGDGSACRTVKMMFNQSEGFGYVDIGLIPKGARGIKVMEVAEAGNFLAVRSKDPEKYYLNGGFIIQWNGEYKVAGTVFQYDRTGDLENLTAPGPTNESIWIQLLFQETNPGIHYEYTVRKEESHENEIGEPEYFWQYGDWTACSVTCGRGVRRQIAHCMRKGSGAIKNSFCDPATQPNARQKKCYEKDCPPRWWAGEWQKCSTTCGPTGQKKRTVLCIQTVGSDEQALAATECQHLLKPKTHLSCNRDVLCPSDWTVSNWTEQGTGLGSAPHTWSLPLLPPRGEEDSALGPCSGVGSLPQETVLHEPLQPGSFPRASFLPEPPWRGSFPRADLQPHAAPARPFPWSHGHLWGPLLPRSPPWAGGGQPAVPPWAAGASPPPRSSSPPSSATSVSAQGFLSHSSLLFLSHSNPLLTAVPGLFPDYLLTLSLPLGFPLILVQCSTTCGMGAFWRHVECSSRNVSHCQHTKKPDPARKCYLRPCASWKTGNWSKCSANCNGGFKTRDVHCIDVREKRLLRPFHCQLLGYKPQLNTTCNMDPCLQWHVEPWNECSRTCGGGQQKRHIYCPEGGYCDWTKRPNAIASCNRQPCTQWIDQAWGPQLNTKMYDNYSTDLLIPFIFLHKKPTLNINLKLWQESLRPFNVLHTSNIVSYAQRETLERG
uniref:ADAM metallopeptidase with thrombospondin type 1 motif 12 n=1 Tax=Aquila chrysaetos chrysaetos TaxID=223781 RepID=A0A663FJ40_AQUCH